ncbi:YmdB family metallophosphoesterase [Mycoplasmopsis citelli]|uniref:Putative metallophosphoesterase n=1 Tax=Mycoplasmopsis citelli TaxID=171281 RepID=A0A449B1M7_9BACT|nr:TIGR00282 family metallophosphoesterase [Mycoplasmopsis citelli]UUD35932.1 YmdB family metallophosphoesterase [Mycoplasmopsis citelli]VEU74471.1 putative metallophosphoesterase [Mycoplasmopsis citelli]
MAQLKILFFGDIFGKRGLQTLEATLPKLREQYQPDFIIAQGENVSGRKGLTYNDYLKLKSLGVNVITMGNHVWAKDDIATFINNSNIIRPLNVEDIYPGVGAKVFEVNKQKLLVISLMGISFNPLLSPWKQDVANNFFDAFDYVIQKYEHDFVFVDFHGETTSEKNVFGLYADGTADAICGTHTHVQTSDGRTLPKGTLFITDVGMTGPQDCAIGASYEPVYNKMRFNTKQRFEVSDNPTQLNAVLLILNTNKQDNQIITINQRDVLA